MTARQINKVGDISKKLDFNQAQKQRLNVLAGKLRGQRTYLMGKTTDPRTELQSLVASATLDKAKAQAQAVTDE